MTQFSNAFSVSLFRDIYTFPGRKNALLKAQMLSDLIFEEVGRFAKLIKVGFRKGKSVFIFICKNMSVHREFDSLWSVCQFIMLPCSLDNRINIIYYMLPEILF